MQIPFVLVGNTASIVNHMCFCIITSGNITQLPRASSYSKYWSTTDFPLRKSRTHPQDKLQAEQPTLIYLSQWELPLELLCPDSCWASRRIFSMSPLWMEEEDGTCSRPPFLPLPLSLPLPLPFICSSTQEPAGQPRVTGPAPSTPRVYQRHPEGNTAVPGSDNTLWAEEAHKHGTHTTATRFFFLHPHKHPEKLRCCSDSGGGR